MADGSIGRLRLHYPSLGSTNDLARELGRAGYPHGAVVVADYQTAGRGRQGRRWEAPLGAALLCSTLLRPALPASALPALTMAAALATADAVTDVTGRPAALKWPNDVLAAEGVGEREAGALKKVAGILVETAFAGNHVEWAVVGVGVNVSAHPPGLVTATDVSRVAGRPVARAALLDALMTRLEAWLPPSGTAALDAAGGISAIAAAWRARLTTLGRPVRVAMAGEEFDAVAETVDPDGALLVRTATGARRRLLAADVTLSHRRSIDGAGEPG
jgi:BirA family biotin operon repressor/biotin-[acetyl-CoA-carboxylase] ligase